MLAISGLDVAFVGSLAALAAAVFTPLSGWLITRATHDHERQIAHDQRIFDLRREVYEQLVVNTHHGWAIARDMYKRLEDENYQPPPIEIGSIEETIRPPAKRLRCHPTSSKSRAMLLALEPLSSSKRCSS